jgi:hypothetical protein
MMRERRGERVREDTHGEREKERKSQREREREAGERVERKWTNQRFS